MTHQLLSGRKRNTSLARFVAIAGCQPALATKPPELPAPLKPDPATCRLESGQEAIAYGEYSIAIERKFEIRGFSDDPERHSLVPGDRLIVLDYRDDEKVRVRVETGLRSGEVRLVARKDIRPRPR
jgi:hypothetical protein